MKKIENFARQKHKKSDYNHDISHIIRTVTLAKYIAKKEKADVDICVVAAWLHDIGQSIAFEKHNETGAKMARKFLLSIGMNKEFTDNVVHCIICHSTKRVKEAQTKEAKVLYDADMLQCLGAFGYTRLLSQATVFMKFDLNKAIKWVKSIEKKCRLHSQTKTGKKFAKEFLDFMQKFYKQYEKEDKVKFK